MRHVKVGKVPKGSDGSWIGERSLSKVLKVPVTSRSVLVFTSAPESIRTVTVKDTSLL